MLGWRSSMVLTFPQIGLRHSRVQTKNITISPYTFQVLLLIRYTRFHFQYCYYCVAASFHTKNIIPKGKSSTPPKVEWRLLSMKSTLVFKGRKNCKKPFEPLFVSVVDAVKQFANQRLRIQNRNDVLKILS